MRIVGRSSQKPAPSSSAARSTSVGRWAAACAGPPTAGGGPPGHRTGRPPCTSASGAGRIEAEAWGPGAAQVLEGVPGLIGLLDDPAGFDPSPHPLVAELHRRLARAAYRPHRARSPRPRSRRSASRRSRPSRRSARGGPRSAAGASPPPGPAGLRLPPPPATLARLPYWELHRVGLERKRADTIRRVAREAGRLDPMVALGPVAVAARLESIVGVGPWTSAEVNAVALGDPDAVSVGDYHLPHQVSSPWPASGGAATSACSSCSSRSGATASG